ncbi:peptidase S1 and S6 chymotrypsin/Hap [Rivularia sp. IAM M-261]|nr:peptidase S1 and S6 chymotrypsin/Hap [Rivularia sp. IAM M-261]
MYKSFKPSRIYLILLLIASTVGCTPINRSTRSITQNQIEVPTSQTTPNNRNSNFIAQVIEQVGPAVVRIDSTRTVELSPSQERILERYFGGEVPTQGRVRRGVGSGFIISPDGQIFTNAHVVANANQVSVLLTDGRRLQGKVLGVDRVTDVAVVKINATDLPVVKFANSDNLIPGEPAIAIGNPLGLDNTVTQGIISATERSISGFGAPTERLEFIQTDAAINPGNSGGPLLNSQGEVVGINTAIIQGAQGIGFSIPINTARRIGEQLITKGRVEHPYIGVQMAELTPELRDKINRSDINLQINQDKGVIILEVARNSPAARAGLRPGDVIESINNVTVENVRQMQQQVENAGVGNTLPMSILRNGSRQTINVRAEALPQREPSATRQK